MAVELSYFQKLWNRGVDIGVGVITSIIVGLIGLAFWRVKLWLDLRADEQRQRQQHRISSEFETRQTEDAARAWRQRLLVDGERLAAAAEAAADFPELARCWASYALWLRSNQLNDLSRNLKVLHEHGDDGRHIMSVATHGPVTARAREIAGIIRNTELPAGE